MNSLDILLISCLLLIALISIIGNLLVIIAFSKESRLRHLTGGWCLISLAITDLCRGTVANVPAAIQQALGTWVLGKYLFRFQILYQSIYRFPYFSQHVSWPNMGISQNLVRIMLFKYFCNL